MQLFNAKCDLDALDQVAPIYLTEATELFLEGVGGSVRTKPPD